jgi:hypothetical protein
MGKEQTPITCMNGIDLTMTEHEHSMLANLTNAAKVWLARRFYGVIEDGGELRTVLGPQRRGYGSVDHDCDMPRSGIRRHADREQFCLLEEGRVAKSGQKVSVGTEHSDSEASTLKIEEFFHLVAASVEKRETHLQAWT